MRLRARALVTEGGRGCVSFLFLGASGSLSSLVSVSGPTPSAGLLVVLSLTLFVANCETLQPRPQVSYLVTTYLCWGAGAVTLGAGEGRASGGRGGVSAGQGAEPGENTRQGFWPDWGGPPGRSASRDRAGPRAGFGVHQPIWPPPPGTLSYLNYVGMWGALHGAAAEPPAVRLAAEHPEVHVRTAAVRPRLEEHRGRAQFTSSPRTPV